MINQSLRGLVGQGMDGRKAVVTGDARSYAPGNWTFRPSKAGYWKFVLNGPGGVAVSSNGGGSGAYLEKTVFLDPSQTVAIVVGRSGTDTTVTFASGVVLTAGTGAATAGGTASGGDLQYNGSAGGTNVTSATAGLGPGGGAAGTGTEGGAGAPGTLEFPGGAGGTLTNGSFSNSTGRSPGGGASHEVSSGGGMQGGDGRVVAFFVRP